MRIPIVAAVSIACATLLSGCFRVAGQSVPKYALDVNPADFSIANDELVLHYYGAGGWGVLWRNEYLLLAPYFSNHPLEDYGRVDKQPRIAEIAAGVANTPFAEAGMIVVGHGHADHAGDISGYFSSALGSSTIPVGQAGLIANRTTQNMLDGVISGNPFRCEGEPAANGAAIASCSLTGFRITPLVSDHAPNMIVDLPRVGVNGLSMSGFATHQRVVWPTGKEASPADFVAGDTWAYLIDLLNTAGDVVFRIHYMDAAAGPGNAIVPAALLAERPIDVHIACVPGFELVRDYPKNILNSANDVGYVFLGHWEDFFRDRNKKLRLVAPILNQSRLNRFVQEVETSMLPGDRLAPVNKGASDCPTSPNRCGPHGERWAMPVPGEGYRFDTMP